MSNRLKLLSVTLLLLGVAQSSFGAPVVGPEIDAGTSMNALALLAGAALVVRSRFKK